MELLLQNSNTCFEWIHWIQSVRTVFKLIQISVHRLTGWYFCQRLHYADAGKELSYFYFFLLKIIWVLISLWNIRVFFSVQDKAERFGDFSRLVQRDSCLFWNRVLHSLAYHVTRAIASPAVRKSLLHIAILSQMQLIVQPWFSITLVLSDIDTSAP